MFLGGKKVCDTCKSFLEDDEFPPCHQEINPDSEFYNFNEDSGYYECRHMEPELGPRTRPLVDAYLLSDPARDGMTGSLNYDYLGENCDLLGLSDEEKLTMRRIVPVLESQRQKKRKEEKKAP